MSAYCLGAWRWCILISSSTFFWTSFLTTIFLKYTLLGAGKFFTFHPCLVSSARVTPSEFRQNFWWEYHNAWTNRLYKIDNNFHSTLPCPHSSSEMPLEQSWSCWYIHAPDVCWTSPSSTPPILQQQITNTKRYISHWIPTPSNSPMIFQSSSSRMSVMNRNWLAAKQRLHPQSVAEISRHLVWSDDRIRQCGTSSGLDFATRTQISVCKSPFPSAGTAVSLFRAKTVQQRPLLLREVITRLPDCGVAH